MKYPLLIATWIGVFSLVGCNPVKSTAEADKAAAEFHLLFDAQDFDKIYDTAHADFKKSQAKVDTISFLRTVREKLGPVKVAKRTGWRANSYNMKTNVVLTFDTEFEKGRAVETFTYRIADGSAILLGWHVNSNDLILTKPNDQSSGGDKPADQQHASPSP